MSEILDLDAYTALAKQETFDRDEFHGPNAVYLDAAPGEEVAFANQKPCPTLTIQKEKPEHRMVLFLKAQGYSNREICRMMNFTDAWVSQLVRQDWFQRRLVREMNEAGRDSVEAVLQGELGNSIQTLIQIRDDPTAKKSDRAHCAVNLIDRVLGKPVQRTETKLEVVKNKDEEIEALDAQIKQIEGQLTSGQT